MNVKKAYVKYQIRLFSVLNKILHWTSVKQEYQYKYLSEQVVISIQVLRDSFCRE